MCTRIQNYLHTRQCRKGYALCARQMQANCLRLHVRTGGVALDKRGLILSRPIVNDFSVDVPIKYVEDMMREMFAGNLHPTVAGTNVINLYNLWVNGMTQVAAKMGALHT